MLFLILSGILSLSVLVFALYNGIGPVMTSCKVRDALLADLPPLKGPIVELGAGFGTLVAPLAKRFPKETFIAYENSWVPFLVLKLRLLPYKNVTVIGQDFWQANLQGSQTVICYLYPAAMQRLAKKWQKELSPGTLIITHTFALPGFQPLFAYHANDLYKTPIYGYKLS